MGAFGRALACLLFGLMASGCLDLLGHEDEIKQHADQQSELTLQDDRIEDKHPTFDPDRTVDEEFGAPWCTVTLNKSATVTKLDIVPFEPDVAATAGALFRGRTEALAALDAMQGIDVIPSMEVVNGVLKPFNDGLYAAVELHVEAVKRALLRGLEARLRDLLASTAGAARAPLEDAAVLVGTAIILGGDVPTLDAALVSRAQSRAAAFRATPALARPVGFYTWTPELERIFTRDRFLQNRDDAEPFGAFAALALVLGQDPDLLDRYQRVTSLYGGLTNPFFAYPLDALVPFVPAVASLSDLAAVRAAFSAGHPFPRSCPIGPLLAFVPDSRSKEVELFDDRFCAGVPAGTNLLDVIIQAIRAGELDLAPGAGSGWYDYQLHALETLLLPERGAESQHLLLTAAYKKKLVETFKSILIQTRETHVKQLAWGSVESAEIVPVDVYPLFPVEPFPTFYVRTARAYRFVRAFLEAAVGPELLTGEARVLESGARAATSLGSELDLRIDLLYGLALLSADAVGLARDELLLTDEMAGIQQESAIAAARRWLAGWRRDGDLARDPRVIVPVFFEPDVTTYWAVIGVKAVQARAEFVAGHQPVVTPHPCWTGKLVEHRYTLLIEETAEVRLPSARPPPTRDELRALCDANKTRDAIVRALEGG